jgi:vitamin B12 transporter
MLFLLLLLCEARAQEIPIYKTPAVVVTPGQFRESEPDSVVELPANGNSKAATLDDVVRGVPGVVVARSGGVGQPSSLFLRGSSSEHTLVLIDGVEINDPAHPSGGFDFSSVDLNLVEKVEVYKGPQTLRYGPGAMGGVINIVTKKGGTPKNIFAGRAGDYQTNQLTATRLGRNYAVSATRFETAGVSAAAGHPERDGHRYSAAAFRGGYDWSESTELEWISRLMWSESDLDFATGPGFSLVADDPNYHVKSTGLVNALKARTRWSEGWKSDFALSHYYLNRNYANPADVDNPEVFHDNRHSHSMTFNNVNTWAVNPKTTLAFGPSARAEQAKSKAWTAGLFADVNLSLRPFFIQAGVRADQHKNFGARPTYAFAPGVRLGDWTTLSVRVATAFKAPSLFQIYDATYGNENLNPERVRGEELSLEQQITESIYFKATGFRYHYQDLIQFTSRYENVSAAKVRGGEFEYSQKISHLKFQGAYTYTDARNEVTGGRLSRRPFHSWRVGAGAEVTDYLSLRAEYRGVGSRRDQDAITAVANTNPGYEVADVSAAISLEKNLQVTVSVENAFDRKNQEVSGYGTPGLGVYFGVRAEL